MNGKIKPTLSPAVHGSTISPRTAELNVGNLHLLGKLHPAGRLKTFGQFFLELRFQARIQVFPFLPGISQEFEFISHPGLP